MCRFPLLRHPLMYLERRWCGLKYKFGKTPNGVLEKKIKDIRFVFDFNFAQSNHTKRQYHGTYEIKVVQAMRRHLHAGATFIDIGANIGYISAIGMSMVGKTGVVHSFEPVSVYFERLLNVTKMNPDYNIVPNNFALGNKDGYATIDIPGTTQIGGSSMVPGFVRKERIERTEKITVRRLDSYMAQNNVSNVALIKIDVEGFELPVLEGASGFFEKNRNNLPPIIVEIIPSVYEQSNSRVHKLEEFMLSFGYRAYCIYGQHKIDINKITRPSMNVMFKPQIQ
jgi:FkbM family methyltransferase